MELQNLENLRDKWKGLILKGKIQEAEELYCEGLFSLVQEKFINETQTMIRNGEIQQYDLLVIPMGLEWVYPTLLINSLKPKRVYFLCTKAGEQLFLDKVIEKTNLKRIEYNKDVVEYTGLDATEVYKRIKKRLEIFRGKKIAVDLTRGKRVMSAGAAIVGDFFGCDLLYIDEDWIDEIKRGVPGTESLIHVKNPLQIFGDLEQRYAIELFNKHEYVAAKKLFVELCNKISEPHECKVKSLISEGYAFWDALNYERAVKKLDHAFDKIKEYGIIGIDSDQLNSNLESLKILRNVRKIKLMDVLKNEDSVIRLLIDIYCNAFRRAEQNRIEDAVLRLYRTIELVSQHRLAKLGINTSSPDYNNLKHKSEEKYKEITRQLYGKEESFPSQISLMDGHIILFSNEDDIWKKGRIKDLEELLKCIKFRDHSIVAHGTELVKEGTFEKFEKMTTRMLKGLCDLYDKDFGDLIQHHTFLKLS